MIARPHMMITVFDMMNYHFEYANSIVISQISYDDYHFNVMISLTDMLLVNQT